MIWSVSKMVCLCLAAVQTLLNSTISNTHHRSTTGLLLHFSSLTHTLTSFQPLSPVSFNFRKSCPRTKAMSHLQGSARVVSLYASYMSARLRVDSEVGGLVGRRSNLVLLPAVSLLRSPQDIRTLSHRRPFRTCSMADEPRLRCPLA